MKVNLPYKQVKKVLADCNLSDEAKKLLIKLGIDVIQTVPVKSLTDCTSTHPDMQFTVIDEYKALVCDQAKDYYKHQLPEFELVPVQGISSPYPNDCVLNITVINDICFLTDFQKKLLPLPGHLKLITVKQGYTKCNICILNEKSIITSDHSIYKAAEQNGVKAYYLSDKEIKLDGYDHGFWGGTCGLIGRNKLFFSGDITCLDCSSQLLEILEKEKIEPVYPKDVDLCDNGSILPLY